MENEFNKSEVFAFESMIEYHDAAIVSKHALKKQTGNVSLFAFDKGEALSTHSAPFDALVQVVDGAAEIKIAEQSFQLKKGECIIMPADIPHAVIAIERFKMVLTMIRSK